MNEPYIVQISSGDAIMFGCEYESEFERTSYLLGTDVFEGGAVDEVGENFLSLREWDGKGHSRRR